MITKTLYNQHNFIEEIKLLQVVTYEWKYINIVNSSKFILSEIEEMKNRKNRVENRKRWNEISGSGINCSYCHSTKLRRSRESAKETICHESLKLSNFQPACSSVAYL